MIHIITYSILTLLLIRLVYLNMRYSFIINEYAFKFEIINTQLETMSKLLGEKLES